MFDQHLQSLLQKSLTPLKTHYNKISQINPQSAFNKAFDEELNKLVIHYNFDFEAITIHLYYMFPQYGEKLKKNSVQYRWYQIVREREKNEIQELMGVGKDKVRKGKVEGQKIRKEGQKQDEDEQMYQLEKNQNDSENGYETALKMANILDEQQEQFLIFYKPKFIIDSEYKLERQIDYLDGESSLLTNKKSSQFGNFDAPLARPFGKQNLKDKSESDIAPKEVQQDKQEDKYMDDDREEYQSD